MKLFIFVLLIVPAVLANPDPSCQNLEQSGEMGVQKLLLISSDSKVPTTDQELTVYCNLGKDLYKTLREYKRCLNALPQEILSTTTQSVAKVLKKHCGDKKGREETLKILRCANDDAILGVKSCMGQTMNLLDYMANKKLDNQQLMSQMCCVMQMSRKCLTSKAKSVCDNKSISVTDHFNNLIDSLSKDGVDMVCDAYKSWEQCEQKMPAEMQTLQQIASQPVLDLSKKNFLLQ